MRVNVCARRRSRARRRCGVRGRHAAAALVLSAAALSAAVPAPASAQACAAASAAPGAADSGVLRRALRCLVNAERARNGLRPLRGNRRLGRAASGHAADMVARGYFAHERPGWTLPGRLRAAGWSGGAAAEAIGWGCGGLGVPRAVVDSWLKSPPHRAIVLGRYNRAGVGLAVGSPLPLACPGAGTWVLDVGRK
jgi:uncharacterized protein YkwD